MMRCGTAREWAAGMNAKDEVQKQIDRLGTLRDEVKLHLHLASLDAKQEWDDKLEPRINEVQTAAQNAAHTASEASHKAVHELVAHVEGFVAKLRHKPA